MPDQLQQLCKDEKVVQQVHTQFESIKEEVMEEVYETLASERMLTRAIVCHHIEIFMESLDISNFAPLP